MVDNGFHKRYDAGSPAERLAVAIIKSHGWKYQTTGWESTGSGDPNLPDLMVTVDGGRRTYWEVKSTDAISRRSYECCLSVDQTVPTYVACLPTGSTCDTLSLIRVTDLVFVEPTWGIIPGQGGSGQSWRKFRASAASASAILVLGGTDVRPFTAN